MGHRREVAVGLQLVQRGLNRRRAVRRACRQRVQTELLPLGKDAHSPYTSWAVADSSGSRKTCASTASGRYRPCRNRARPPLLRRAYLALACCPVVHVRSRERTSSWLVRGPVALSGPSCLRPSVDRGSKPAVSPGEGFWNLLKFRVWRLPDRPSETTKALGPDA